MEVIEYENGLTKGYLARRKKSDLYYIISIYLYCIFNLLFRFSIITINHDYVYLLVNSILIILSCGCLCYSSIARKNYEGLVMHYRKEVHAFSKKEKWLFALPVLVFCVFIPLNMVVYCIFAGFIHLAARS